MGTGNYTLALDTAFADTNYWMTAWGRSTGNEAIDRIRPIAMGTKTTSSMQVNTDLADGDDAPVDSTEVGITFWGDYA